MFKYVKTGFGPFKKMKLCETFGHNEKPRVIKSGEQILPEGVDLRPTENGCMQLTTSKGCTNTNIYAIDVFDNCITYLDTDGQWGFITKSGKVIPTTAHENATMSTIEVIGDVVVAKIIHDRSRIKAYVPFDANSGEPIINDIYKSYHCGDKANGIKSDVIFLEQYNGEKTLIARDGTLLTTDCSRYECINHNLLTLSRDEVNPNTTWLEGFDLSDGKVRFTLTQKNVKDFDYAYDELIVYKDNSSSVYDVNLNSRDRDKKDVFEHKFDTKGRVSKINYTFYGETTYITRTDSKATLLDEQGKAIKSPALKNLVDAEYADEHSIITTVNSEGKQKQGMVRTYDFANIIPPVYDKVTNIGRNRVVETIGDTFELVRLIPTKAGKHAVDTYTTEPVVEVEINNYFRPHKTNERGTIMCEDSNGETMVIAPEKKRVSIMPIDKYEDYLESKRNLSLVEIFGEETEAHSQDK